MKAFNRAAIAAAALGLSLSAASAHASWPADRPISMVVPYPPGSSPDTLARALAEPLSTSLKQRIVIENRPGAGGNIGTRFVTRAAPDGYTLVYTINGPLVTAPTLYKKTLGYDPFDDLLPVSLIGTSPNVLTVPANSPAQDVPAFVQTIKSQPGRWNYGSVGAGSSAHLAMEMFKQQADIELMHVPYAGFSQVITAIIGGDVHAGFMVPAIAMPQVRAGKARALAVTSLEPSDTLPGVPTMAAQGFPGFESISWNAILAPKGTPPEIIDTLNQHIGAALKDPKIQTLMRTQYFTPAHSSPDELTAMMRTEKKRWDWVIDALKLNLE